MASPSAPAASVGGGEEPSETADMGFSSWSTVGEEGGVRLVVVKGREGRAAATGLGDDVDASAIRKASERFAACYLNTVDGTQSSFLRGAYKGR